MKTSNRKRLDYVHLSHGPGNCHSEQNYFPDYCSRCAPRTPGEEYEWMFICTQGDSKKYRCIKECKAIEDCNAYCTPKEPPPPQANCTNPATGLQFYHGRRICDPTDRLAMPLLQCVNGQCRW